VSSRCIEGEIVVEIGDSGCGIPPDLVEKVFEPYFTTKEDGTGLGLSFSKRIVESLNGKIYMEASDMGGAAFVIVLPGKYFLQDESMRDDEFNSSD
jgi:signal transduction histidine kinase